MEAQPDDAPSMIDMTILRNLREDVGEDSFPVVVGAFRRDLARLLAELTASVEAADAARTRRAAHALKSLTATIGATTVSRACACLETSCARMTAEATTEAVTEIEVGIRSAERTLDQWS
mgnify:CR=1 FL=1